MFEYCQQSGMLVPAKIWIEGLEHSDLGALDQACNVTRLPFVFNHVALMPDFHLGYGVPIGCVFGAKDVVIPNAVGVDIGCGMSFLETDIRAEDLTAVEGLIGKIRNNIKRNVPVGYKKHKEVQVMPEGLSVSWSMGVPQVLKDEYENASYSLGTLGGGNHFIEIQKSDKGTVCLMVHSGSRNLGKKIADFYNDAAKKLNTNWHSKVDEKADLAFLPVDSIEGQEYIDAMNYALRFAFENRKLMMERVTNVLFNMVKKYAGVKNIQILQRVNIHHNYAALENHYGKNLWIHRKGATSAKKDEIGIIPGSQGTSSYIVRGLGNRESFMSCSHGAGRVMGRMEACRTLDEKKCSNMMNGVDYDGWGKVGRGKMKGKADLSESPLAYKDIDMVMKNQDDLVEIVLRLKPLGVIKG